MDLTEFLTPSLEIRFWAKVDKNGPVPSYRPDLGPCWLWTASTFDGYGKFNVAGSSRQAHQVSYQLVVGPVPAGLELDHLCRVRSCVNPSHLEPVTQYENGRRGESLQARNARKTHCPEGHEYTPENIYRRPGSNARYCVTCHLIRTREAARERRADPLKSEVDRTRNKLRMRGESVRFAAANKNTCVDCGVGLSSKRPSRCNPCNRIYLATRGRLGTELVSGMDGVPYPFP